MNFMTIDCGTTNTRVYLVSGNGCILDKEARHVGVRNTAMTGSADLLRKQLREMIAAIRERNPAAEPIGAIFSSGMITSEIGLRELPHLKAPCGLAELAEGLTLIPDLSITDDEIPVYFVPGIKNSADVPDEAAFTRVHELDFMRGEETQVMGLVRRGFLDAPGTVLVLSSHSKFIPVVNGKIQGSLTTASGQVYAAILDNTFVGKSVRPMEENHQGKDFFDAGIVRAAAKAVREGGLARCMMYPRFQDVLLQTQWYARKLFFDACVAADDMRSIEGLKRYGGQITDQFLLIGQPERCRLYQYILQERFPDSRIRCISDTRAVDQLSIDGILTIAEERKVISQSL